MSLMTPFISPSQSIKTSQSTMCSLVTTSGSGVGIDADWPNSLLFGSFSVVACTNSLQGRRFMSYCSLERLGPGKKAKYFVK